VALVGLEILSGVGLRTQVDLALFSADQEEGVVVLVEVEAHASRETEHKCLLFVLREFLVAIIDELELDDFLGLKLVLHEVPVGDSSIG